MLVASDTVEEHEQHLEILFSRLSQYGVIINPAKGEVGTSSVTFLGHVVDEQNPAASQQGDTILSGTRHAVQAHIIPRAHQLLSPFHPSLCRHCPTTYRPS